MRCVISSIGIGRKKRGKEQRWITRSIDISLVIDTFLLLLIGVGPKIGLAGFGGESLVVE